MGILKSHNLLISHGRAALLGGFIGWFGGSKNDLGNHGYHSQSTFSLVWGVASLPKTALLSDLKAKAIVGLDDCGEDSYCALQTHSQSVIAVADGVGGWRKRGVDPSAFSRGLMQVMQRVLVEAETNNVSLIGAKALLSKSFWRLVQDCMAGKSKPFGSSTACLISLDRHTGKVEAENLGDSGFLLVEVIEGQKSNKVDVQVLQKSLPQQSRFNAPFQISIHPNGNVSDQTGLSQTYQLPSGGWLNNDNKNDDMALTKSDQRTAQAVSFKLAVLASDGLWDNLFEADIVQSIRQTILGQCLRQRESNSFHGLSKESKESALLSKAEMCSAENFGEIAWNLVRLARIQAERSDYTSPFSVEASRHGMTHVGGKLDDITVIVASVIEHS